MRWGHKELVAVAYDLCGGREVTPYYVCQDGLAVILCAACGLAFASLWEMLLRRAAALGLIRTHHPYVRGGTRHNLLAVPVRPSENAREDLRT